MYVVGYILLALIVVAGAAVAVFARNLIQCAIALGFGSAALSALLFMLHAPYAGGFELSVGAGLISVLFIMTISLTEPREREPREPG